MVADGNALTRRGLVTILREGDLRVVGEATTAPWALQVLQTRRPNCLVAADDLPNPNRWNLIEVARSRWPDLALVALGANRSDESLLAAMAAGASAYVPKSALPAQLLATIQQALASPRAFVADDLLAAQRRRARAHGPALTARELEVLTLLAEGLSTQQVSERLFIAPSTTKSHLARIYAKLSVSSRSQALMAALNAGLLPQSRRGR